MSEPEINISASFGALLVGGFVAIYLSGVLGLQSVLYFKSFPSDITRNKILVALVWILDISHTIFISLSVWGYLITNFGQVEAISQIRWPIAVSIPFTAISTLFIQSFFILRIFELSNRSLSLVVPMATLSLLRMGAAFGTMGQMLRYKTFPNFLEHSAWIYTLGLATSTAADVMITVSMWYLLRKGRRGTKRIDHILDKLILHALENGSLTSAGTILALACWLAMPYNRVFLGTHFVISKLYSNSLLATLHARKGLRGDEHEVRVITSFSDMPVFESGTGKKTIKTNQNELQTRSRLEINIQTTVSRTVDAEYPGTLGL